MSKKKEQKKFLGFFRFTARVWIISLPAVIVIALLLLFGKIGIGTSLACLFGVFVFTAILTSSVFKELENFISYLKNLAQGWDIEPPHFKKGVFSSFRLADTFQTVKNRWLSQTLSDAQILDHLPEPLLMVNEQGIFVMMNQQAQVVLGKNLLGKKVFDIFPDSPFNQAVQSVLADKMATEWFEWAEGKNQLTFQVRMERLPAPTRSGGIVVITLHDITPFKRFREQQMDFFASVSHELKTPLSVISGMIETLQGAAKEDPVAREQFLNMMAGQTNAMTDMVQKLLVLSKQQIVSSYRPDKMVNVVDILNNVIGALRVKAKSNHQKIVCQTGKNIPLVFGNEDGLWHAFQNLIDNAIKYGLKKSMLTIRVLCVDVFPNRSGQGAVMVSVHNWGHPISPRHLDKLFDRFYRVETVSGQAIEGTGLGLKIAQQIVQEQNGMIDVMSSTREGTTFVVYLPIG